MASAEKNRDLTSEEFEQALVELQDDVRCGDVCPKCGVSQPEHHIDRHGLMTLGWSNGQIAGATTDEKIVSTLGKNGRRFYPLGQLVIFSKVAQKTGRFGWALKTTDDVTLFTEEKAMKEVAKVIEGRFDEIKINAKRKIKVRLLSITVDQLAHHPHEQASRVADNAVIGLVNDISKSGYIAPLTTILNNGKYVVVDGNRRLVAARILGWKEVPCALMEETTEDIDVLFAWLNAHQRLMRGHEKLNFLASCNHAKWDKIVAQWPKSFQERLKQFEDAVGRDYVIKVGREGKYGPEVMQYVNRLCTQLANQEVEVSRAALTKWVMENHMQNVINIAMRRAPEGISARDARNIARCVREGRLYKIKGVQG